MCGFEALGGPSAGVQWGQLIEDDDFFNMVDRSSGLFLPPSPPPISNSLVTPLPTFPLEGNTTGVFLPRVEQELTGRSQSGSQTAVECCQFSPSSSKASPRSVDRTETATPKAVKGRGKAAAAAAGKARGKAETPASLKEKQRERNRKSQARRREKLRAQTNSASDQCKALSGQVAFFAQRAREARVRRESLISREQEARLALLPGSPPPRSPPPAASPSNTPPAAPEELHVQRRTSPNSLFHFDPPEQRPLSTFLHHAPVSLPAVMQHLLHASAGLDTTNAAEPSADVAFAFPADVLALCSCTRQYRTSEAAKLCVSPTQICWFIQLGLEATPATPDAPAEQLSHSSILASQECGNSFVVNALHSSLRRQLLVAEHDELSALLATGIQPSAPLFHSTSGHSPTSPSHCTAPSSPPCGVSLPQPQVLSGRGTSSLDVRSERPTAGCSQAEELLCLRCGVNERVAAERAIPHIFQKLLQRHRATLPPQRAALVCREFLALLRSLTQSSGPLATEGASGCMLDEVGFEYEDVLGACMQDCTMALSLSQASLSEIFDRGVDQLRKDDVFAQSADVVQLIESFICVQLNEASLEALPVVAEKSVPSVSAQAGSRRALECLLHCNNSDLQEEVSRSFFQAAVAYGDAPKLLHTLSLEGVFASATPPWQIEQNGDDGAFQRALSLTESQEKQLEGMKAAFVQAQDAVSAERQRLAAPLSSLPSTQHMIPRCLDVICHWSAGPGGPSHSRANPGGPDPTRIPTSSSVKRSSPFQDDVTVDAKVVALAASRVEWSWARRLVGVSGQATGRASDVVSSLKRLLGQELHMFCYSTRSC